MPDSSTLTRNSAGRRKRSEPSTAFERTRSSGAPRASGRGSLRLIAGRTHLVADTPDGHDRGGVFELAAQLPHVDVNRARVAGERVPPYALEQLVAGKHEAAVIEQLPEQVEFLRRELDLAVAHLRLAAPGVDR